ncbi:MAG TPA: PrsW family glutamic-type intramembrane protease, partial [Methanolinea sp.]|nr:PrsW family glutamic-type intramembrane protease [Methanolinea sp.]
MERWLLFLLAMAPGFLWLYYFYSKDRYDPEPVVWVLGIFLLGATVTVPVAVLEGVLGAVAGGILAAVVVAPVCEEIAKFFVVKKTVYRSRVFDEPVDGIIYAAAAGRNGGGSGSFAGDVFLPWEGGSSYYSKWSNGPSSDPDYFPIAVWLQSPHNADAYRAIGINTFVGLWEGQTEDQLGRLAGSGMPVLCSRSATGLGSSSNSVIRAWTHVDEPDNAQADGQGGYGPPISTETVLAGYQSM